MKSSVPLVRFTVSQCITQLQASMSDIPEPPAVFLVRSREVYAELTVGSALWNAQTMVTAGIGIHTRITRAMGCNVRQGAS